MSQPIQKTPAVFMRGGTSKALVFHERDLPAARAERDCLFLAAMGSPDPYGRQLDGMGGGLTSLSKVCVIGPPTRPDADIDYTFVQVIVKEARVSYAGNCGNMSSAVGPFAVDEGLVAVEGNHARVRIHNTNTGKIIVATFPVDQGRACVHGELVIPGVAGSGAPIRLDFLEPGGAGTGRLLPTAQLVQQLEVPGHEAVEVSIVDAANPCVFIDAASVGLTATEMPEALEADARLMAYLHAIGAQAGLLMGRSDSFEQAMQNLPLIALVAPPTDSVLLSGASVPAAHADLCIRMLSNGQPHRALPGTGSICTAVAMRLPGSLPHRLAGAGADASSPAIRLAMPSGVMTLDARVELRNGEWHALHASIYRTARRLFKGDVYY